MTGYKQVISSLVGQLNIVAIAILLIGDMIFDFFGGINRFPTVVKESYQWIKESKVKFCAGIFIFS